MDFKINVAALKTYCNALQTSITTLSSLKDKVDSSSQTIVSSCLGDTINMFSQQQTNWADQMQKAIDQFQSYHDAMSGDVTNELNNLARKADDVAAVFGSSNYNFDSAVVSLSASAASEVHSDIRTIQNNLNWESDNVDVVARGVGAVDGIDQISWVVFPEGSFGYHCTCATDRIDELTEKFGKLDSKLTTYEDGVTTFQSMVADKVAEFNKMKPQKYNDYSAEELVTFLNVQKTAIIQSLYEKYAKDPNSWKDALQQAPGDISEAEYQALASYFLNDCNTADKQEEFLNACLTTKDGKTMLDNQSQTRFANVTRAAESQYAVEQAVMAYAYDTNDKDCGVLWAMFDKHYQNLALLRTCTAVTQQRMKEQREKYTGHQEGIQAQQIVYDFHISLGDGFTESQNEFGKADGYKATLSFTEGSTTTCTATIYDYSNPESISKKLQDVLNEDIGELTGADPTASAAKVIGGAAWDKAKDKIMDKLIDKATQEALGKVTGPVGVVIDAAQAYDEAVEQNALGTRMINENNASHACEDFGSTGYYVEVTTDNVFHWPWESEKKDYYIPPTWDLHQSEASNDSVDKFNYENDSGFLTYDEAIDYALSIGED